MQCSQWLLINHALPVESRLKRDSITWCRRCEEGPEDLPHVFDKCPRAKDIYRETNLLLANTLGITHEATFVSTLNPGSGERDIDTKVIDTINAITSSYIWKDCCNFTHENEGKDLPAEAIAKEIGITFALSIKAEIKMLYMDLKAWNLREAFHPCLLTSNPEIVETIDKLEDRIDYLKSLIKGSSPWLLDWG